MVQVNRGMLVSGMTAVIIIDKRRSINQSMNQSIKQSIIQSMNKKHNAGVKTYLCTAYDE